MRDIAAIRTYVWDFLDLEEEDLQSTLIDVWILEGWRQIVRRTRRWPFFEFEWDVTATAADHVVDLAAVSPVIEEIDTISGQWGNLDYADEGQAREDFNLYRGGATTGRPEKWTYNAGKLRIYPIPDQAYPLQVTGWRVPTEAWMDAGTGAVPDFPEDLEDALLSWVMHRAYQQQDDPENSGAELKRYSNAVNEMVSNQIQGPQAQPFTLGGGRRRWYGPFGERPVPWGH